MMYSTSWKVLNNMAFKPIKCYRFKHCKSGCNALVFPSNTQNFGLVIVLCGTEEKEQHEELERMAAKLREEKAELERQLARVKAKLASAAARYRIAGVWPTDIHASHGQV